MQARMGAVEMRICSGTAGVGFGCTQCKRVPTTRLPRALRAGHQTVRIDDDYEMMGIYLNMEVLLSNTHCHFFFF